MSEWKPIETAPKDGSPLLLWDGFGILYGRFSAPIPIAEWWLDVCAPEDEDQAPDTDGYQEYIEGTPHGWISETADEITFLNPIFWHALPEPPK